MKLKKFEKYVDKRFFMVIGSILLVLAIFNMVQLSSINDTIEKNIEELKEQTKPSDIEIITILDNSCTDCTDVTEILSSVKKSNVKVLNEESLDFKEENAKKLIRDYAITKLPAVIIKGNLSKLKLSDFKSVNDGLVFDNIFPPYTNALSGEIEGLVEFTLVKDSSCEKCQDIASILNQLKTAGVTFSSENILERSSKEGQDLITKYGLDILPAMILSEDIKTYDNQLLQIWDQIGSVENDGSFVTRKLGLPYLDLVGNKVVGLLNVIYLADETCETCYDPELFHKPVLQNMGLAISESLVIDSNHDKGKELIDKYKIEKLPTIIILGDVGEYPYLEEAWKTVGSIEEDGAYVFRSVELAKAPYKDLLKDEVVEV